MRRVLGGDSSITYSQVGMETPPYVQVGVKVPGSQYSWLALSGVDVSLYE